MKTALSAIALVAALTLAPSLTGSFAVADDSAQREEHGERFSPEDRAAFLDARIAALQAGLERNPDQEKNWACLNLRCAISPSKKPSALPRGGSVETTIKMGTRKSAPSTASPALPSG